MKIRQTPRKEPSVVGTSTPQQHATIMQEEDWSWQQQNRQGGMDAMLMRNEEKKRRGGRLVAYGCGVEGSGGWETTEEKNGS